MQNGGLCTSSVTNGAGVRLFLFVLALKFYFIRRFHVRMSKSWQDHGIRGQSDTIWSSLRRRRRPGAQMSIPSSHTFTCRDSSSVTSQGQDLGECVLVAAPSAHRAVAWNAVTGISVWLRGDHCASTQWAKKTYADCRKFQEQCDEPVSLGDVT